MGAGVRFTSGEEDWGYNRALGAVFPKAGTTSGEFRGERIFDDRLLVQLLCLTAYIRMLR